MAPNLGLKPVSIEVPVQRVECRDCGVVRQARLSFADPRRSYTRSFERMAVELSRRMTIKDVALHLRVSWDVVKDIVKRYLHRRFARRPPQRNQQHAAKGSFKGHALASVETPR